MAWFGLAPVNLPNQSWQILMKMGIRHFFQKTDHITREIVGRTGPGSKRAVGKCREEVDGEVAFVKHFQPANPRVRCSST